MNPAATISILAGAACRFAAPLHRNIKPEHAEARC
jgi:hypothetical protein